jgi:LysM repeat protein
MKFLSPRLRSPLILLAILIAGLVWGSVAQAQTFDSTYRARSRDTHQSIASRHGISVALLQSLNPHIAFYRYPTPGTVFLVPTAALIGPIPNVCRQLHSVNPGETLAWVGGAYHVPLAELARINNLSTQSPIYAGHILCLPIYASLSGQPPAPAAVPGRSPIGGTGPVAPLVGPWTGYYYNFLQSSAPVLTRTDANINFNWGTGSPGPGVGVDNFSAVWQGNHYFSGANYRFMTLTDDGVRVWVGGVLVIDGWKRQATTLYFRDYAPPQGTHLVQVEYFESGIDANISVNWAQN